MLINKRLFGTAQGKDVYEYTMKNSNGVEVACLNYGCTITKIITPNQRGVYENIVLGFEDLEKYKKNSMFAGAIVGRVAGRIANAQFELEGNLYALTKNDGPNHLHGGNEAFHHVVWDVEIIDKAEETVIVFSYTSLDGAGGYPGNLVMEITYTLTNKNELIIAYRGQSDKTTLCNPTNHTYFNLSGNLQDDVSQHTLKIDSSRFVELTEQLIPTGNFLDVENTVFDFRGGRKIIEGIHSKGLQNIIAGQGYDHPFILDSNYNGEIVLRDEKSGRVLTIETDAVGVVLYTGNHIPGNYDIYGIQSRPYLGLCLETQGLPDAIHHSNFPSCVLEKDQVFSTVTKYIFSV